MFPSNMNNMNMNNMNMNNMNNNMFNNNMNPFMMNNMYNNFNGMNPMNYMNMMNIMNQMNQMNMNQMNNMNQNNNIGGFNNQNNMMNQNNNNSNNNNGSNVNTNNNSATTSSNKLVELLPREEKLIRSQKIESNSGIGNIINIALNASTGLKVIIPISSECTIETLLKEYAKKVGIPESVLGTKIVFLFNGGKMEIHSQEKLEKYFKNGAIITVFDQGGIIGA